MLKSVSAKSSPRKTPSHLSKSSAEWWLQTIAEYHLEQHHELLLTSACEALDRAAECRLIIDAEGLTTTDRFGQSRPHSLLSTELASRAQFAKQLRELDLDSSPAPAIAARRGSRYS